jgi:hypothetical protein
MILQRTPERNAKIIPCGGRLAGWAFMATTIAEQQRTGTSLASCRSLPPAEEPNRNYLPAP